MEKPTVDYKAWAEALEEEIARLTAELEQAKSIAATALSEGTRVATTLHIAQSELAKCERERGILKHQRSVPLPALTPESLLAYGEEVIARGDHNRGAQYCCLATTWMAELAASQERERVLREAITNYLDGNYPNPRTYRHKPWREGETPGYCPHLTVYFKQCENCDAEYWRAALGEDGGNG